MLHGHKGEKGRSSKIGRERMILFANRFSDSGDRPSLCHIPFNRPIRTAGLTRCEIDKRPRAEEKPSDHAPIVMEIH